MTTRQLIDELQALKTKSDIEDLVNNELHNFLDYFASNGYRVDKEVGFVNRQVLKSISDLDEYQRFRSVHFLYMGLIRNNWNIFDHDESVYFESLRDIVEPIYQAATPI